MKHHTGHIIVFDGVPSTHFGMVVSGEDTWIKPAPEYERISVPGRSGDLLLPKNRFENVNITYHCLITKDFDINYQALANHLYSGFGYRRLEDSYHPEEYRMGAVTRGIEPRMSALNKHGMFDITFDCKPQRWLKTGDYPVEITKNGADPEKFWGVANVFNPTGHDTLPWIDFNPSASIVSGMQVSIYITDTATSNPTDSTMYLAWTGYRSVGMRIDSENKLVYGLTNGKQYNDAIDYGLTTKSSEFPVFKPGMNYVYIKIYDIYGDTYNVSLNKNPVIYPRWWAI